MNKEHLKRAFMLAREDHELQNIAQAVGTHPQNLYNRMQSIADNPRSAVYAKLQQWLEEQGYWARADGMALEEPAPYLLNTELPTFESLVQAARASGNKQAQEAILDCILKRAQIKRDIEQLNDNLDALRKMLFG